MMGKVEDLQHEDQDSASGCIWTRGCQLGLIKVKLQIVRGEEKKKGLGRKSLSRVVASSEFMCHQQSPIWI